MSVAEIIIIVILPLVGYIAGVRATRSLSPSKDDIQRLIWEARDKGKTEGSRDEYKRIQNGGDAVNLLRYWRERGWYFFGMENTAEVKDNVVRVCTCPPGDRPEECMHRYALSRCKIAYLEKHSPINLERTCAGCGVLEGYKHKPECNQLHGWIEKS